MQQAVVDNRYVLHRSLGSGGMGKVFLARDRTLERDLALKVLREQYVESEEFVERFEREAKAAASLNHPNIVQVYDRGTTEDGTYYIAMEYVPGGDLKERILERGALNDGEATRLASQVADALGVAHASGIVHRDVKPQNVLLTADGDAKVADFGIARAASEASLSNSSLVLGTAKYMSPEQAMGDPLGPESDLYSLGVVLYEMLTGEVPFEADSSVGVAMKHVTEPPRPPREKSPAVPEALDAVAMKLLEKKPEDRYQGAAELVADLSRVGEGLPPIFAAPAASETASPDAEETELLAAPAAPIRERPAGARRDSSRSWARRRRTLVLLASVALVALLGLAGLGLSRSPGGQVLGSLGKAVEEAGQALGAGEGEVPGVVGLTERGARERLAEEGFGVAVERRESAREKEGRVLEQSVSAGKEAPRGSRIALAVGDGPRTVKAPDLVGLTPEKAQTKLDEADLKLGERKEVPSEEVPEDEVSAQDPRAGKKTEAGTEVDLKISSGPPAASKPDRVEVPEVSGLGVAKATALLEEAGCEVAGTREKPSPEPKGTVIGTDPPIGTAVASGTPVILIVSGGPGAPPAGDPSGDPPAQPAPSSSASASASATASPDASAPPEPPSEPDPPQDPPAVPPSSPEPAPSSPAPSPPAPSSPLPSSSPATNPPASTPSTAPPSSPAPSSPAPSSPPSRASSPALTSPSPERDDVEEAGEETEGF